MKGGMGKEEMENARRAMEDNVGSEGSKGGGVGAETGKDKCIERSHKREREREREGERKKQNRGWEQAFRLGSPCRVLGTSLVSSASFEKQQQQDTTSGSWLKGSLRAFHGVCESLCWFIEKNCVSVRKDIYIYLYILYRSTTKHVSTTVS